MISFCILLMRYQYITPWPEPANELYRPSYRCLLAI
jgi:hypothetical protein